jgi:hypothetical protein
MIIVSMYQQSQLAFSTSIIHPSHPSIIIMAAPTTELVITRSLVDDPRNSLKKWLEAVEYVARTLCAAWDSSGALTLVANERRDLESISG